MDLLLWRHAEAEDGSPDAARRLTPRGERQAERMARWLDAHAPKHLRMLVSPARRTRQTAAAWREDFETTAEVGTETDVATFLAATGWPNASSAVMVVGHQPTLGEIAALLLHGEEAGGMSVKKGALWWLQSRERDGELQVVLRSVINADLLE